MDIRGLKRCIYENGYIEQLLTALGTHHIRYHTSKGYFTCGNPDGDNKGAILVYNDENLGCINFTRNMISAKRSTDLIDLVMFIKQVDFIAALKFLCAETGISYYSDFNENRPQSLKLLDMLDDMKTGSAETDNTPLSPISESILTYYKSYVNDIFLGDNISYETQAEFEIGFDPKSNRITIPIRTELGDLAGVKGRYFYKDVPKNKSKYIYVEPCSKTKIIYGLYKTLPFIKKKGVIYIGEAEKFVLQLWSYGFYNSGALGGKTLSDYQADMLVRLGARLVFCFDKDVSREEIQFIAESLPQGVPVYTMLDTENILVDKESPSDNPQKWQYLAENNIYKIR